MSSSIENPALPPALGRSRALWKILDITRALATVGLTIALVPTAVLLRVINERAPLWLARVAWARGILRIGGVTLEAHGVERIDPTRAQVVVANHTSMVDIPVVFRALKLPLRFVLKRELAYVLPIGIFAWLTGMIFVNRRRTEKAHANLGRVATLASRPGVVMAFPEGTRSRGRGLLPFKRGVFVAAIDAGIPVVPMAIAGAEAVLPSDGFRVRPGRIRLLVGTPIETKHLSREDRGRLADEAHAAVAALAARLHKD